MISANVVNLAIEYLDMCAVEQKTATLVGMYWHIDSRNKSVPLVEEVNEALKLRPQVLVSRENASVVFSLNGFEHAVAATDMAQAYLQYIEEFNAAYKRACK